MLVKEDAKAVNFASIRIQNMGGNVHYVAG